MKKKKTKYKKMFSHLYVRIILKGCCANHWTHKHLVQWLLNQKAQWCLPRIHPVSPTFTVTTHKCDRLWRPPVTPKNLTIVPAPADWSSDHREAALPEYTRGSCYKKKSWPFCRLWGLGKSLGLWIRWKWSTHLHVHRDSSGTCPSFQLHCH